MTDKQRRFVAEYLIHLDATRAARSVGYSAKSASSLGHQLLKVSAIKAAVIAGKAAQLETRGITADRVLLELGRVAFANARDYWLPTGDIKHPVALTVDEGAALAGFEVLIKNVSGADGLTDTVHKFKLWDKVRALELLAKHLRLLDEHVEITDGSARVARLEAARKRVAAAKDAKDAKP